MKLTKIQQRYAGILLIGVTALAIDKLCLSPQGADASVINNPDLSDASESASFAITADVDFKAQLVGRISDQNVDAKEVPDLFRVPESWSSGATPPLAQISDDAPDPHLQFAQRRTLNAVTQHENVGMAIVDSVVVRVGAQIDGFTLIRVGSRSAVFQHEGRDVILELSDDIGSTSVEITSRDSSGL